VVKAYSQSLEDNKQKTEIEKMMVLEVLASIKRAGADYIITYWAKQAAKWLK